MHLANACCFEFELNTGQAAQLMSPGAKPKKYN